jgi:hypothetical protein
MVNIKSLLEEVEKRQQLLAMQHKQQLEDAKRQHAQELQALREQSQKRSQEHQQALEKVPDGCGAGSRQASSGRFTRRCRRAVY